MTHDVEQPFKIQYISIYFFTTYIPTEYLSCCGLFHEKSEHFYLSAFLHKKIAVERG